MINCAQILSLLVLLSARSSAAPYDPQTTQVTPQPSPPDIRAVKGEIWLLIKEMCAETPEACPDAGTPE